MQKVREKRVYEALTFDELVQHGLQWPGVNIVNGMPWHFEYKGASITHENDQCYLILSVNITQRMTPEHMLMFITSNLIHTLTIKEFEQYYEPATPLLHTPDELPEKELENFSVDVCTIDNEGTLGGAYYDFEMEQWIATNQRSIHADKHLPTDKTWKWYYPTVTFADAFPELQK